MSIVSCIVLYFVKPIIKLGKYVGLFSKGILFLPFLWYSMYMELVVS